MALFEEAITRKAQLCFDIKVEDKKMKLISWNVNGLRAAISKGFIDFFKESDADIFCVQETKMQEGQANIDFANGYFSFFNSAVKKGYS